MEGVVRHGQRSQNWIGCDAMTHSLLLTLIYMYSPLIICGLV